LSALEVDATFYHAPKQSVTEHWAAVTPDDFAFACKLPQAITHGLRLREVTKPLREFLTAMEPLGKKLWCVVVQLPPSFRPRRDETALRDFVRHLPTGVQFAIEFRNTDWHVPRIAHLLQEHGVAWVWNDLTSLEHQKEGAFEFLPDTTDFLYVRLMGDLGEKYDADGRKAHQYTRVMWPRDAGLESWGVRLGQAAADHRRIFVAVSNHFEGFGPHTAQRLGERMGVPVRLPNASALGHAAQRDSEQLDLL
jgi:uncharacterized protein YecE (DUF72 family)